MFREKFRQYFGVKIPDGITHYKILCQWHNETAPSCDLDASTGKVHCFGCNADHHIDKLLGDIRIIPEAEVDQFHLRLLDEPKMVTWLKNTKGYVPDTIRILKIGYNGARFTYPVRARGGQCINLRLYSASADPKYLPYAEGYGAPAWYPHPPTGDQIFIMEGESDTTLARQFGLNAFCQTGGANCWTDQFTGDLSGKDVILVYDTDRAGRDGAQTVVNQLKFSTKSIRNIRLPVSHGSKDFSNWILRDGGDMTTFKELLQATPPYAISKAAMDMGDPILMRLAQTSDCAHAFVPVEVQITVCGKDRSPYLIPKKYKIECQASTKNPKCTICPNITGSKEYELSWRDGKIVRFVDLNDDDKEVQLRLCADVPGACRACRIEVQVFQNAEKVAILQKHDWFNVDDLSGDNSARKAIFLGAGMQANTSYRIRALPMPDPRDQSGILLIIEAEPVADLEESTTDVTSCEMFRVKLVEETAKIIEEKVMEA